MADEQNTNWDYKPANNLGAEETAEDTAAPIQQENLTWTAKEFIEHERGAGWYMVLILGSALLAAVIFLVTKDFFAAGAILAVGVMVAIYVGHKPKELTYIVSDSGMQVGEKKYSYNLFKSFSVAHEGQHASINLEPVKRLMPPMTLYFPPENEEQVVDAVGNHLPFEEHKYNITDRLAHRLRI
jgi:hypothetical protein